LRTSFSFRSDFWFILAGLSRLLFLTVFKLLVRFVRVNRLLSSLTQPSVQSHEYALQDKVSTVKEGNPFNFLRTIVSVSGASIGESWAKPMEDAERSAREKKTVRQICTRFPILNLALGNDRWCAG
jgi:hypothetical protein